MDIIIIISSSIDISLVIWLVLLLLSLLALLLLSLTHLIIIIFRVAFLVRNTHLRARAHPV